MKKWIIIVFCFLLVACDNNAALTAETPDKALQLLESQKDYPKIIKLLNSIEINEEQVIYVFEGEINNQSEWFVANIEKVGESKWLVKESINVGLPNSEAEKNSAGTNTFNAGISNVPLKKLDDRKVVTIPGHEYFVWIELNKD